MSASVMDNVLVLLEVYHYLDYFQSAKRETFKIKILSFCGSWISKSEREEHCKFTCGGAGSTTGLQLDADEMEVFQRAVYCIIHSRN